MPKKKRGGGASAKRSLSERQNVAPGTKLESDVRLPQAALEESLDQLLARAEQIRSAQLKAAQSAEIEGQLAGLDEFNVGAQHAMDGEWAAARTAFALACTKNSTQAAFWHYRGLCEHRDGQLQLAVQSLREAVRVGGQAGSEELLTRVCKEAEDEALAEVVVTTRRAADTALQAEEWSNASRLYGQTIEAVGVRAPELAAACHHGRAYALAMLDEWAEALTHWQSAVTCCAHLTQPDQMLPTYQHYCGVALQQLERWEDAASALRTAVDLGSERSGAFLARLEARSQSAAADEWRSSWEDGWRHFAADESKAAIKALEKSLALGAPDSCSGYLCIGFAHAKLEQWREGVAAMTSGLNSAPSAEDEPDWTFQGLSRQQLDKARQNCAGMAAKTSLQQISAAVLIQAGVRGWLIRRRAAASVEQHVRDQESPTHSQGARAEVLSPALRTSPGVRRSISLEPGEPEDGHHVDTEQEL
jgi:tetratricopeptide (TPR) repeat protein